MISESWFAIDSDDSPLRNREITTVMLGATSEPAIDTAFDMAAQCGRPTSFDRRHGRILSAQAGVGIESPVA